MLEKKIFGDFIKQSNKARQQFCIRKYTNNNLSRNKDIFYKKPDRRLYSSDEAINKSPEYKNFWDVTKASLQHWRILSTARLLDPPFFRKNIEKQNLSIYYIIELLEDKDLKSYIKKELERHNSFIKWIKKLRDTFLAHNSLVEKTNTIPWWIEDFFESLNTMILKIEDEIKDLNSCWDINLKHTENLSESGVKEIFEKLIK